MNLIKKSIILTAVIVMIGCSGEKLPEIQAPYVLENLVNYPFEADNMLSLELENESITASEDIKTVRPGELNAQVGELSETYFEHQFIGLVSREYFHGEDTFFVEIAQFVGNENAFGFHARLRPDGTTLSKIGAESYTVGNSLYIYKGEYAATISATNINDNTVPIITDLAKALDVKIETGKTLPVYYMIFPSKGKIDPSNKYSPYQHLNIPGFDKVFTCNYQTDEAVFTLFISMDADTAKFKLMEDYAKKLGKTVEVRKFPYDEGFSLAFKNPEGGFIVAGRVRDKLVGVIGYKNDLDENFIRNWIKGLQ